MSISFGQVSRFVRHAAASIDKLSTVRVASVRYSVPFRLVGRHVEVVTHDGQVRIYGPDADVVAEHVQLAAGEASVLDEHYPTPRNLHRGGHAPVPMPSESSSPWANRPRRSSVKAL